MIKDVLKIFTFSKIIFLSVEAHSYTYYKLLSSKGCFSAQDSAARHCGSCTTGHFPCSFTESPFLWDEDHIIPHKLLLSGCLETTFLKTSLPEQMMHLLTYFYGGCSPRISRGSPPPPAVFFPHTSLARGWHSCPSSASADPTGESSPGSPCSLWLHQLARYKPCKRVILANCAGVITFFSGTTESRQWINYVWSQPQSYFSFCTLPTLLQVVKARFWGYSALLITHFVLQDCLNDLASSSQTNSWLPIYIHN